MRRGAQRWPDASVDGFLMSTFVVFNGGGPRPGTYGRERRAFAKMRPDLCCETRRKPAMSDDLFMPGRQRPGGRTERVRKDVATTVLALIQEGRIDFSYNEVAEISGINKTTLYRRWPQRADLIREALSEHSSSFKIPKKERWPDVCEAIVRSLAALLSKPVEIAMNVSIVADPGQESSVLMAEQWQPILQQVTRLIDAAKTRGDLPPSMDTEIFFSLIISPLLMQTLIYRAPVDKKFVAELVATFRAMHFEPL